MLKKERIATFDPGTAAALAERLFGVVGDAQGLPAEYGQNFVLNAADGRRYTLKIAPSGENEALLAAQNEVMQRLTDAGLEVPSALEGLAGGTLLRSADSAGEERLVRLLTYLPGALWVHSEPHSGALLEDLGRFLGAFDRALEGYSNPAFDRELQWDLLRAKELRRHLAEFRDSKRRELLEACFEHLELEVLPVLSGLRRRVIHNDANTHNVLVDGERVSGIIDFGDMVHTALIGELAIALAYALLDKDDPVAAALPIARGYRAEYPLEAAELALLPALVQTRLAVSLAISGHRQATRPDDDDVQVTREPAWRLLERLDTGALAAALSSAEAGGPA